MINLDNLFSAIDSKKIEINKKGKAHYNFRQAGLSFKSLNPFLSNIKYLSEHRLSDIQLTIVMDIGGFVDNATIFLFSFALCYLIMKKPKSQIYFRNVSIKNSLITKCVISKTPLINFLLNKISCSKFLDEMMSTSANLFLNSGYYLRTISPDEDSKELSKALTEIKLFLNENSSDIIFNDDIKQVISELCGNALEHSRESCFIYISKSDNLVNNADELVDAFFINIICFSEKTIFTDIKNKYYSNELKSENVQLAYAFHKKSFNSDYNENHFFMLSAIQPYVTGRSNQSNGGTGLPTFIKKISNKVDNELSYVVSGTSSLNFERDLIGIKNQQIGLNENSNFVSELPSKKAIAVSPLNVQGILYNIVLVIKKENNL